MCRLYRRCKQPFVIMSPPITLITFMQIGKWNSSPYCHLHKETRLLQPSVHFLLSQAVHLCHNSALAKGNQCFISWTRKDQNETILSLWAKAGLAVCQVVVPYAQEYIVKAHLSHYILVSIKPSSPLCQCFSIMKSDVINMFKAQSRPLVRGINKCMERRAKTSREDYGVDKVCRA